MLRGISYILSPELLKILCEMDHSDRIAIADGNFLTESTSRDVHVIHTEGRGMPEILEAIFSFFPLDTYAEHPACLMSVTDGDMVETPTWDRYMTLVEAYDSRGKSIVGYIERFALYEEAKKAYAIIAASEKVLYANIMPQKGVVTDQGL